MTWQIDLGVQEPFQETVKSARENVSKIHQHKSTTVRSALAHSKPKLLMQSVLKIARKKKI